jgi:rubrerythrin
VSAIEELEAIDWYDQRIDATTDEKLRTILAHNRDEEKEHAALLIAWLASAMRSSRGAEGQAARATARRTRSRRRGDGSLGIGSLRGRTS